jgi:hypothetical protein
MAFSGGTFSRLYDWTTDRDNGVKILASRMDQEFDGMATGLSTCILKDGTQTCTAAIPFAQGITLPDNKTIILGTNSDITIQYDESTNDSLEIKANVEGAALGIVLKADQGDDNADQHKVGIADGGTLTMASKISGSFVSYLTHTPNSTVASSTTAVAGNLTVGGDLTLGSGAVISEAELEAIDGVTAGTVTASKAVIVDSNKDIASFRNVTLTGELDAGSLDVSGDADIDGTLEADAITVNGTALNTVIAGVTVTDATNSAHVLVTDNESTNEENLITFVEDATSSTGNVGLEMDGNLTYNPSTGTVTATVFKGNIDAVDGDFDGTLEADAMTLNGTAITATATLDTGISNNNVPKFTSGVADDDFLRVAGTAIEGRSAAEVLSDIGGQASLTFGISNTNAVKIDSASVADDEYARFTASGLESRATSEVLSDIAAAPAAGSSNIVTTGALNSGSITSGFGAIDNGASAITTTGVITGGTLEATADTSAGDNAAIGYTSAEGLILTGQGSTSDITLKNDADATVFTVPTGTDDILFPDSAKILMGNSSDLALYHDGSNSYIVDNGTGDLNIRASDDLRLQVNSGGSFINSIICNDAAAVDLYHNNNLKLSTSSGGVDITGGFTATAASTITTSDNSNNLTLTSTDADANTGPNLVMTRASGSPADNDAIGELTFNFNNDAAENTVGTRWRNFIIDASDGTEDAAFDIFSIKAGALTSIINYDASTLSFNDGSADIDFRVESNGNANMLTVNAGEDKVGIGRDPGTGVLDIQCGNTTALQAIRIADTSPTEYFGVFNANEGGNAPNAANATLKVRGMNTTNRAINAGGTVNASGADYAEYMIKADGVGTIAKGAVCGVDADGKLTDVFANAHSFVIKSTDPSYVGGDVWSIASTDADGNQTTLEGDALETARQTVDRIAFSGQVPCTITGTTKVGDFVIAQAKSDGGIEAVAVTSPTFEQYSVAIGKVWKLGSSQHTVAVKIG